ncbi:MAG TPA: SBBP repeat-containing protein [Pyrinomonadaceae bacterium]|nr:SBBP repeat-containing protein [Pyrinomonadaceae bacterium]
MSKHGQPNQARVSDVYGKRPMSFEVNQGQVDDRVKFLARGSGYNLFLTATEAVFSLTVPGTQDKREDFQPDVLRMKLVSANSSARVTGVEELPGRSNYLLGNDPKQWHTDVAHYARVRAENVYQGIDIVYYGNEQELEYDFVVAPGANPSAITLSFDGTQSIETDAQGDLVLRTPRGEVRQRKPFIYQENDGRKRQVDGQYVKMGKEQVGFEIGEYDHSLPLVIDPLLLYSTYLGGSVNDYILGIATDAGGNSYVVGGTGSPNFPTTAGAFQLAIAGGGDVVVTKMDPSGSILLYSTYIGGSGSDSGVGIAVDGAGNAYVVGYTLSLNFPTTPGAFDVFGDINQDSFVTKLNPSGTSLGYSTYLGGGGRDEPFAIAVDSMGQAYVTGSTQSLNFPVTFGVFDTTFNGMDDVFVTKVNATGTAIGYSTFIGGTNREIGVGIAVDISGNAYVTGMTESPNFPSTIGAFDNFLGGSTDSFVLKLNSIATGFYYSTFLGGTLTDIGFAIAVDGAGFAYVTGYTVSTNFPTTPPAFDRVLGGWMDAFVTKVGQSGTGIIYSTYLGGSAAELGFGIAVDGVGQAYVTGYTSSSNFPTTLNALDATYNGGYDVIVTKVNQSGSALSYSSYHGGSGTEDYGRGIAIDGAGNVFVGGYTNSTNFPITPGAFSTTYNGASYDGFVSKFQL